MHEVLDGQSEVEGRDALVAQGVFDKRQYEQRPPRYEYVLTEKGRELLTDPIPVRLPERVAVLQLTAPLARVFWRRRRFA